MKLILWFYEVSQTGSRMGPELTRIDHRYDLQIPSLRLVPRWPSDDPQTGPEMALLRIRPYLRFY